MEQSSTQTIKRIGQLIPLLGVIFVVSFAVYGYRLGIFRSQDALEAFVGQFGRGGIIIFIVLQAVQVIIPILPGGISCGVGILLFGNMMGLVYNYIGIIAGEIIGFLLVRHYGKRFVTFFLTESQFDKFNQLLDKQEGNIKRVLIFALLVPFAPDDVACLMSGLSNITFKDYLKILLPLKVWSIGIYSLMMMGVIKAFIFK